MANQQVLISLHNSFTTTFAHRVTDVQVVAETGRHTRPKKVKLKLNNKQAAAVLFIIKKGILLPDQATA